MRGNGLNLLNSLRWAEADLLRWIYKIEMTTIFRNDFRQVFPVLAWIFRYESLQRMRPFQFSDKAERLETPV